MRLLVVIALAMLGCKRSSAAEDIRSWLAGHGVDMAGITFTCETPSDDYLCDTEFPDRQRLFVSVTRNSSDDSTTMTMVNGRFGGAVSTALQQEFARAFAGAALDQVACPALIIGTSKPTLVCTGRFDGAQVTLRFAAQMTASKATISGLIVDGAITADALEAAAKKIAPQDLSFRCERRLYVFGRQARCNAVAPELSSAPSYAAELMIGADGAVNARIVKLSEGAPWTPITP